MKPSKPAFYNVIDLGLRDVGVRNDPRRLAARFGKTSVVVLALVVLSVIAVCVLVGLTGADAWIAVLFPLVWMAAAVALALRSVKRTPALVVKVSAEGANQATWLVIAPFLLLVPAALLAWDLRLIPVLVLSALMSVLVWRARGRVPEILSRFRPLLAADESVLGDGIGVVPGAGRWHEAFRLVVATDRRVLVVPSTQSKAPFPLVDVPYRRVNRFGIEWKLRGRVGELSLTVPGDDETPDGTHVIGSMVPANLLSIAAALQSHGVFADDPDAVAEAEREWEEARLRGEPRTRLFDRAAMSTRGFDLGLWLLLGLSAVAFYANPLGAGFGSSSAALPVLVVVPVLCAVCGFVSGTRASLAYIAPLNLLLVPAFFFAEASEVIAVMLVLSALAAIGLWVGSAVRGLAARTAGVPARAAASPEPSAARGSLRHALSGLRLTRISAVLLAAVTALVVTAAAAGFELNTLRLAVDEVTAKRLPVDGRSNLTGNAASLTYTPAPDLREFVTDEHWDAGPNDGARWELRSSFTRGYNVVSLAHYIFEPRLDDAAAVEEFVAGKDREHSRSAGFRVTHKERVVDGRRGYVWTHIGRNNYWLYSAWFPQPVHSVRLECVARKQTARFKRLCAEAIESLRFH